MVYALAPYHHIGSIDIWVNLDQDDKISYHDVLHGVHTCTCRFSIVRRGLHLTNDVHWRPMIMINFRGYQWSSS